MPDIEEMLAKAKEAVSVMAAAGCGKTETIVKAVKIAEGRQLILTHTNAGVASLRSRLRKYSVPESKYRVETIVSWLLKYVLAYPEMSAFRTSRPQRDEWNEVYPAAQKLFNYKFVVEVIRVTYTRVLVDEYQDCTKAQHNLIMKIAEHLPVCVLGDPLQGIFGFQQDPLVDWEVDVKPVFTSLPELETPYRWENGNKKLGEWLIDLRTQLLEGQPIDLSQTSVVEWRKWSQDAERDICLDLIKNPGSIVGIHQWRGDDHNTAKQLDGKYQSIEEMDCDQLMSAVVKLDKSTGPALATELINFIMQCAQVEDYFANILEKIRCGRVEQFPTISNIAVGSAFYQLVTEKNLGSIASIIDILLRESRIKVFRRELLTEMKRAALEFATGNYASFYDAAYEARRRTRMHGRTPEKNVISRTLLIKGLEYDHAIVLNANKLQNEKNFYVAATRGAHSLTILSEAPIIHFSKR